jgi:hypothetical protein
LESNEFFSGMNVNKANDDPNGYNPPDLFAGLSMSMGGGTKPQNSAPMDLGTAGNFNMNQSSASIIQPLQNTSGAFMNTQNTQMNFGMQNVQQPAQSPISNMDLFSGMSMSGAFSLSPAPSPQPSSSNQNTSTEFVNINKSKQ